MVEERVRATGDDEATARAYLTSYDLCAVWGDELFVADHDHHRVLALSLRTSAPWPSQNEADRRAATPTSPAATLRDDCSRNV